MVQFLRFLTCCIPALCIPSLLSADIVFNGGFETGDFSGWILSGNPIPGTVNTANPHSGQYAADLIAAGFPSFMEQFLDTTAGAKYNLNFFLDVSTDSTGAPVDFMAQVNGVTLFDRRNIPPQPYTRYSFAFLATGTSTDLKFGFRNDPGSFFLDDISVVPVPEPSSLWLGFLATAFAIVAVCRRQAANAEPRS